ncbi:hypothetical protein [Segetibacter aerophilus]|uniref:Uncharacterized protein n=1 Tax=Segetibacter aerophilus TaxID=670293 RepID=A0A512B9Y7_9BACT|nr:hypothetical protein [Segetibacter aerophilus]GEO08775.1 hypothetical protein SAE01_12710 [Segetibacter aerophilus]
MKRFITPLVCLLSFAAINAQTSSKVTMRTTAYKLFDYGRQAVVTTTDATPLNIETIAIATGEAGIVEVQCVGVNSAGTATVTGSTIVRYINNAGTITLGTASTPLATVTDAGISGATFAVAVSGTNIVVTVTGKASTTVKWRANTRKVSVAP